MTRRRAPLIIYSGFAVLASACATKSFVQEQVDATKSIVQEQLSATKSFVQEQLSATEAKLTQRFDIQETQLRETSDRAVASRRAIDAADQRLESVDKRVGEVGALASDAKTRADSAAEAAHRAETRLAQRVADRNRYRVVETRVIYFDSDRADIRTQSIYELQDVAKALKADANAVLELQGFADPRGSDRYNYQLTHERVEAVIRYLVQRHSIELRQMQAVAMGKVPLGANEKATPEVLAKTRRVDIRLLAPWSSWEDAQDQTAPAQTATVVVPAPFQSAQPTQAATVVPPGNPEPTQPTQAATVVPPAQPGAAAPTSIAPDQPAAPKITEVPPREPTAPNVSVERLVDAGAAASTGSPGSAHDGDEFKSDAAKRRLVQFLESISSRDFGGKE